MKYIHYKGKIVNLHKQRGRMVMNITIREAVHEDAEALTIIASSAKRYKHYTDEEKAIWHDKLQVDEDYIRLNVVFVAEIGGEIAGYISLVKVEASYKDGDREVEAGYWLDHLYISGKYSSAGVGPALVARLEAYCRAMEIPKLLICCEPFVGGFYTRIGAVYKGTEPSRTEDKVLSLFEYTIPMLNAELEAARKEEMDKQAAKEVEDEVQVVDETKESAEDVAKDAEESEEHIEEEAPRVRSALEEDLERAKALMAECEAEVAATSELAVVEAEMEVDTEGEADSDSELGSIPFNFFKSTKKLKLDENEVAALLSRYVITDEEEGVEEEEVTEESVEVELVGRLYIPWGQEVAEDKRRARVLLKEFNNTLADDKKITYKLLKQLLGKMGEYIHIEPTFRCTYGYNIHVGENFYASFNCVILDSEKVTFGDRCILSPQVGIYTSGYPEGMALRSQGYETSAPITIGDDVWIGGGSIITQGVTIGDNVIIAPGSVVSGDIPSNVKVSGNPARIVKALNVE